VIPLRRPETTALPPSVYVADRGGPLPLYHELAEKIEQAIVGGEMPAGARLEDEGTLSERLGVSRPTMRRAIQLLAAKGLLVRRRGLGTQVVPLPSMSRKLELTSLWDDLTRLGKHPSTTVIECATVPAPTNVASELAVAADSPVLHMRRLRSADDTPIALLENYLPEQYGDITAETMAADGLYETLSRRGVTIRVAHQSMSAVAATTETAALLAVPVGAPLIQMSRTAFDFGGRATETGVHLYRPDLYTFETTLVRS
jgi:DNA-binding GntR family transcriptional regulator